MEEAEPDFSGATESFETLRALAFLQNHGALYRQHRDKLKDTVIWNIEQGLALTPEKIARAESLRTELFHRMRRFLERYDFLLCPVNQLPPYPVAVEWPRAIAGVGHGKLPRLDEELLLHHHHQPSRRSRCPPDSRATNPRSRSACRSSGATGTTSACCSSRTPSSRPPGSGSAVRPSRLESGERRRASCLSHVRRRRS